jgi:hypothetical protein
VLFLGLVRGSLVAGSSIRVVVVFTLVFDHKFVKLVLDLLFLLLVEMRVEFYREVIYIFRKAGGTGLLAVLFRMYVLNSRNFYRVVIFIVVFADSAVLIL